MDTKFFYSNWRPVSSLPLGNGVGFPAVPDYQSVSDTSPNPDYISAHATLGKKRSKG